MLKNLEKFKLSKENLKRIKAGIGEHISHNGTTVTCSRIKFGGPEGTQAGIHTDSPSFMDGWAQFWTAAGYDVECKPNYI